MENEMKDGSDANIDAKIDRLRGAILTLGATGLISYWHHDEPRRIVEVVPASPALDTRVLVQLVTVAVASRSTSLLAGPTKDPAIIARIGGHTAWVYLYGRCVVAVAIRTGASATKSLARTLDRAWRGRGRRGASD